MGEIVSWCGVTALVMLSVLWLQNPVPKILLAVWGITATVSVAREWPKNDAQVGASKGALIFMAPFHPMLRVVMALRFPATARGKRK